MNAEDISQPKSVEKEKPCSFEVTGGSWTTTTPSGLRVASVAGKEIEAQPILTYHATDPLNGTVSLFISILITLKLGMHDI